MLNTILSWLTIPVLGILIYAIVKTCDPVAHRVIKRQNQQKHKPIDEFYQCKFCPAPIESWQTICDHPDCIKASKRPESPPMKLPSLEDIRKDESVCIYCGANPEWITEDGCSCCGQE